MLSLTGVMDVLHCVLVESPEALNVIKEGHIHSIISFFHKHGHNHKVLFAILFFGYSNLWLWPVITAERYLSLVLPVSQKRIFSNTNKLQPWSQYLFFFPKCGIIFMCLSSNCWIKCSKFSFQVLEVLCSLCVCHGVAVRFNQNLICDNLLPERDLLLQTRLGNQVTR